MQEELFILLRLGLGTSSIEKEDAARFLSLSPDQWTELSELAILQGMAGIAFEGLQVVCDRYPELEDLLESPEVENAKYEWMGVCISLEFRNQQQVAVLRDMAEHWVKAGCKPMLMKGQANGLYYPNPDRRSAGDVDVYMCNGYEKGNEVADSLGAVVDTHWYKHSQIHYKDEMFENHLFFVTTREGKRSKELNSTLCTLLEGQTFAKFPDSDVLLPPVMFNALFLTYHSFSHFLEEGLHLKQMVDWAMFLKAEQDNIDWDKFYELCDCYHFRRFVDISNEIAVKYLGVEIRNPAVVVTSKYTPKVLHSIFHDDDFVFSSGKSGWTNRLHIVTNMFKYSWKYHQIYQHSILKQLWYYASGFIFHTE